MLSETNQLCQFGAAEGEPAPPASSSSAMMLAELDAIAARPDDELANFVTHGMGFLLSAAGAWYLLRAATLRQDDWTLTACAVYSATLVSLYAASTLSHAFFDLQWRRFYQTLDQACIFLLIAGSYTPFAAVYLRSGWWPVLTLTMWILALSGAGSLIHLRRLDRTGQIVYCLLGWLPAISLKAIIPAASLEIVCWVIAGGMCYTLGIFFLRFDRHVRYFHAMWHVFVIGGSICHYIAILLMVSNV